MQAVHQVFTSKAFPLRSTMCFNPLWACVYLLSNCKVTLNPYGRLECIFTPVVFLFISQQTFLFYFLPLIGKGRGDGSNKKSLRSAAVQSTHFTHFTGRGGHNERFSYTHFTPHCRHVPSVCVCVCGDLNHEVTYLPPPSVGAKAEMDRPVYDYSTVLTSAEL